ncbi:4Fe-4S dicluster domain-containing protein [Candidatus Thalassolituus haligoni]|uniref:4Fe-4S dicluster domain-containing protein n=1 Tax=Candidatus Thalassolituus haligoni TaxID=3100113 RepID=UPI0035185E80
MKKWNLLIDVELCENCNNCVLATKDEYLGNDISGYSARVPGMGNNLIAIESSERGSGALIEISHRPVTCNHCDNAPCIQHAPDAIQKRADGIVIVDPEKAHGRKDIVGSCPYGAIYWNEELALPQQWIFDAHLLDQGWKQPRGAQACPTHAIYAVQKTDAEMQQHASAKGYEVLKPELGTSPRVYYRNNHHFTDGYVAGAVFAKNECLAGVQVTLECHGQPLGEAITDEFGEFRIHKVPITKDIMKLSLMSQGLVFESIDVGFGDGESSVVLNELCMI